MDPFENIKKFKKHRYTQIRQYIMYNVSPLINNTFILCRTVNITTCFHLISHPQKVMNFHVHINNTSSNNKCTVNNGMRCFKLHVEGFMQ
jgi:hypothetical protein